MLKIFWFRKDLRIFDNNGLKKFIESISGNDDYIILYIKNNSPLKYYGRKRIKFLLETLSELKKALTEKGFELEIIQGKSLDAFKTILNKYKKIQLFANIQVEPYSVKRDNEIKNLLEKNNGSFSLFSDNTIFKDGEILKKDGRPYSVFTPFKNKAIQLLSENHYMEHKINFSDLNKKNNITLNITGKLNPETKSKEIAGTSKFKGGRNKALKLLESFCEEKIGNYKNQRDFPSVEGTSLLSPYLHFGAVSVRECLRAAFKQDGKDIMTWLNELVWREFYYYITFHYPYVINGAFKKGYNNLNWSYDRKKFKAWCGGNTGYPVVDAGMRQLNSEGWMHNRVRMITAMFLTKDLMIDWMWGEKYFAEKLIDLDFSSNNGGWQWSASTGCDAQPYFRIFNPVTQSKKFDGEGNYIRKYIPELKNVPAKYIHQPSLMNKDKQEKYGVRIGIDYPFPVVNHSESRQAVLNIFNKMRK